MSTAKGVLKESSPLPVCIYFIVSPRKEILFEVLIDKQQRFTISADTSNIPEGVAFSNSPEQYSSFSSTNQFC
jgi:hypothetical protein